MITNKCFECGATEDLQQHHVVPRSRGGTKTITLCTQCHAKAHGKDMKGLNHSRLTREGLAKAKKRGVKLGNPNISRAQANGHRSIIRKADQRAMKYGDKINNLRLINKSYREIGELLNIATKKGTRIHSKGVQNIHNRWLEIQKEDK